MGVTRVSARRRTAIVITVVIVIALLAGLAAAAWALAPIILPQLQTSVVETTRTEEVRRDGHTASIDVPAGWSVQREGDDVPRIVVRTPDTRVAITVEIVASAPAVAVDASGVVGLGPLARESVSSGAPLVHAETADTLVAAVGGTDSSASARVIAAAPADTLTTYRVEIAHLLDTVRVVS
ncbi:hypothetical protein [Microbacterium trichothecenolyticum]|uniref:SAF domain-containing protein n=1 Tax=Microbacterium trichothecenolyticum TaxID=69370 RepID=A0ABU0TVX1_MICTR|nr:hypothetical protein [Microbacterium trichothecenolyticum]MDQ1123079.1 hypothetical protein [Microbacterium trichothecenolyticum]